MITITDGQQKIIIKDNKLRKYQEYFEGIEIIPSQEYWGINLILIPKDKNCYKKIIKCYPGGDFVLEEFNNLDVTLSNKIILSVGDYKKFEILYNNMNISRNYKKEAIVESVSTMFSYECYQNYILEESYEVNIDELFNTLIQFDRQCYGLRNQIYKRTKIILNTKYKTKLLDDLLKGENN